LTAATYAAAATSVVNLVGAPFGAGITNLNIDAIITSIHSRSCNRFALPPRIAMVWHCIQQPPDVAQMQLVHKVIVVKSKR
jgi:hypothetical protein